MSVYERATTEEDKMCLCDKKGSETDVFDIHLILQHKIAQTPECFQLFF